MQLPTLELFNTGAVQPKDLDKMQQCFEQLMALQRLAVGGEPFGIFSPQVHTSCISGSTRNYA